MRKTACNLCDKTDIPLNDSIKIEGKVYCYDCYKSTFIDSKELEDKIVEKELDPTICSYCKKDFGEIELNKISVHPICEECNVRIKEITFPNWVKAFFVGITVIVIGSIFWNWKYYSAYLNIKKSNEYFAKGDYSNAANLMKTVSEQVTEVEDLKSVYAYFKGLDYLSKDKSWEALLEFQKCKDKMPAEYRLQSLILNARIGVAFDNKEYKSFLTASLENLSIDSVSATSYISVASAYACLYAEKGLEDDKQNSLSYLTKAKKIDSTSKETLDYCNMVEYRIYSRKIIKREDFNKQFPHGWNKN